MIKSTLSAQTELTLTMDFETLTVLCKALRQKLDFVNEDYRRDEPFCRHSSSWAISGNIITLEHLVEELEKLQEEARQVENLDGSISRREMMMS